MPPVQFDSSDEYLRTMCNSGFTVRQPSIGICVERCLSHSDFHKTRSALFSFELDDHLLETSTYHQIGQSSTDVASVTIEMDVLQVGSEPVGLRCPHCQEDMMTKATYSNTRITHIVAIILGIFFWWLCCCFVPYFIKRWKNVDHHCPYCKGFLGVYSRTSIF